MNKNFIYIFGYIFLFMGCEIDQTENDVYGCCHSDAWNYNSDVTVHVDSVCIYDFTFTNPTENSIWTVGNNESISWLGGDSDLSIGIMVQDVISGDVGIFVRRYNVMEPWREEELPIWAWDMMWTGPSTNIQNRNTPFTEFGILGLLNSGRWAIVDKDPKDVNI